MLAVKRGSSGSWGLAWKAWPIAADLPHSSDHLSRVKLRRLDPRF
jgi:hypothetical protein